MQVLYFTGSKSWSLRCGLSVPAPNFEEILCSRALLDDHGSLSMSKVMKQSVALDVFVMRYAGESRMVTN